MSDRNAAAEAKTPSERAHTAAEIVERFAWRTFPAAVLPPGPLANEHAIEAWADELPGHVVSAATADEALRLAKEMALGLISRLIREGKEYPVPLAYAGRTQQVSLKLTAREAAEIDGAAAAEGVTRSEFVRKAALDRVRDRSHDACGKGLVSAASTWHAAIDEAARHRAAT